MLSLPPSVEPRNRESLPPARRFGGAPTGSEMLCIRCPGPCTAATSGRAPDTLAMLMAHPGVGGVGEQAGPVGSSSTCLERSGETRRVASTSLSRDRVNASPAAGACRVCPRLRALGRWYVSVQSAVGLLRLTLKGQLERKMPKRVREVKGAWCVRVVRAPRGRGYIRLD